MPYSEFTLNQVRKQFNLKIQEIPNLFIEIKPIKPSENFCNTLEETLSLAVAIDTEKARSELIIMPILLELWRKFNHQISLFSGTEFNVDSAQGLKGYCDYLISLSSEQLSLRSPVITIVETKNENINLGFGQCISEMVAAQIFNQQEENQIKAIYGVVTIGTIWRFIKLEESTVFIDLKEYYIRDIEQIFGILCLAIEDNL